MKVLYLSKTTRNRESSENKSGSFPKPRSCSDKKTGRCKSSSRKKIFACFIFGALLGSYFGVGTQSVWAQRAPMEAVHETLLGLTGQT